MQAFKCCTLKVDSFNLMIDYSIQRLLFLEWAQLLFNTTTILNKMVLNHFEVMISYTIAVTMHARRKNLMSFCSYSWIFFQWRFYDCHGFLLDWLCVHSWTQTLCIKQGESDLHLPRFSSCHNVSPQFSSVKAGRQQMKVRWKEFVWVVHVHIWQSWAVLHCWTT